MEGPYNIKSKTETQLHVQKLKITQYNHFFLIQLKPSTLDAATNPVNVRLKLYYIKCWLLYTA